MADADAVLLLENTKLLNYVNEDRQIGFDSEATLVILKVRITFNLIRVDLLNFI